MENKLSEFVKKLREAAGNNLVAAVLYGSAATGEFVATHSDLNTLCIVQHTGANELQQLHEVADWWIRDGNPAPLIFTLPELRQSADIFAIELLDMKHRHRMLFGADFLETLEVPLRLHRLQVERELRSAWVRLRQAVLVAKRNPKEHLKIMLASHSTFATLFRHAVMALELPAAGGNREALAALASATGADPSAFVAILDVRQGKRKEKELDVESVLQSYVEFVEIVTNEVDRRLAGE